MRANADPLQLTPAERRRALAAILAAGVLRLRDRRLIPPPANLENPENSAPNWLELTAEKSVSVHTGLRFPSTGERRDA
jgi:hypothetical protein